MKPRWMLVWLAPLALASACKHSDEQPHTPTGVISSSGLPPLIGDGGSTPATLPDAAPMMADLALAPDQAVDRAEPDLALLGLDAPPAADGGATDAPGTGGLTDADVCSSLSATAKPLPVDIFVLLDRSSSMDTAIYGAYTDAGTYYTRWTSIREALTNFVSSPAATGLSVGLGYFPPASFDDCNVSLYAMPTVPVDVLPGVATPFLSSLNMIYPAGGTPTLPALQGAIQYAHEREMKLGRRTAIALATDGEPNSCGSSLPAVSQEAMMAAAQGIYTFVIGVGESLTALNQIAMAGGTKSALLVANATPDQLANAFKTVQSQAAKLACTFSVPPPPSGQMLDTDRSTVHFQPMSSDGGLGFDIPIVANRAACTATGGWYVDDLFAPKMLTLCDATCQKVNGAGDGEVTLQFACRAR